MNLQANPAKGAGWTIWREIVGTFMGMLPLMVVIAGFLGVLYADVATLKMQMQERAKVSEAQLVAQGARDAAQDIALQSGLARIELQLADIQRYLRDNSIRR